MKLNATHIEDLKVILYAFLKNPQEKEQIVQLGSQLFDGESAIISDSKDIRFASALKAIGAATMSRLIKPDVFTKLSEYLERLEAENGVSEPIKRPPKLEKSVKSSGPKVPASSKELIPIIDPSIPLPAMVGIPVKDGDSLVLILIKDGVAGWCPISIVEFWGPKWKEVWSYYAFLFAREFTKEELFSKVKLGEVNIRPKVADLVFRRDQSEFEDPNLCSALKKCGYMLDELPSGKLRVLVALD